MSDITLGTIQKVDLREAWANEARDFTPWLAKTVNLNALGDTIGIEMELIEPESSVGDFSADLFAEEVGTGRKIIIENQLEDTNHIHLGQIITYAAGKEAEVIIWIVKRARDEHRLAIEWLNQNTDTNIGFFLIELELWRIGNSDPAPRFNIVERPNDWAKSVKVQTAVSETKQLQLQYWSLYNKMGRADKGFVSEKMRPQKAQAQSWNTVHIGVHGCQIDITTAFSENRIGVALYIPDNKALGEEVERYKSVFEERIGVDAIVIKAEKASGLRFHNYDCNLRNKDAWRGYIQWQLDKAVELKRIFKELKLDKFKPNENSNYSAVVC